MTVPQRIGFIMDESMNKSEVPLGSNKYDAVVLAVAYRQFFGMDEAIQAFGKSKHILFDIKYVLESDQVDGRL